MNGSSETDWANKDINECLTFDEVSQYRKIQDTINKNSHDNYERILTGIYQEPTHFIYELLQNADNVRATKAKIILEKNRLVFIHDGKDEFTLKNVISITGVGNSHYLEKKKAGGFGVGFKAVFAICKRPEIYSHNYNFAIENLSIPIVIKQKSIEEGYTTMFILPFSSKKYSNEEIYQKVAKELKSLDVSTIMFLFRLKNAFITTPDWKKTISLSGRKKENAIQYTDNESDTKYLVFRKELLDSKFCSIAYQLDSDDDITEPQCKYISSFFPTKVLSEVNLIIDAPFTLATTRETLDFEDPNNQALFKEIKSLFKDSIKTIKKIGILTAYTISQMPLEENYDNDLAQILYEGFKEVMQSGAYIPTTNHQHTAIKTALIPADDKITKMVKGKKWVDTSYGTSSYYEDELGIAIYDIKDMIAELNVETLKTKSDDWLYSFYTYLANYCDKQRDEHYFEWLRYEPIIKTRTNNFVPTRDNNKLINLFRKSNGVSDAHTIHTLFTTQSENVSENTKRRMLDLLGFLGIQERSPKTTIELDILKKWPKADTETSIKLFHQIADIYNKANTKEKIEIINMLKNFSNRHPLLLAKKNNKTIWAYAPLYENTDELHTLLKGIPDAEFIDPRLWTERYEEKQGPDGETRKTCLGTSELCCALGVTNQLIIKNFQAYAYYDKDQKFELSDRSIRRLNLNTTNCKYWTSKTYYIENYDKLLSNIDTREKGKILLKLLSKIPYDKQHGELSQTSKSFQAFRPHGDNLLISSDPFVKLNEVKWCYDEDNKPLFPYQLTKEEFLDLYGFSGNEPILNHLEFKNDARNALKQEDRDNLDFLDSCSEEELAQFEELKQCILQNREQKEMVVENIQIDDIPDPVFTTEQIDFTDNTPTDTIPGGKVKHLAEKTQTISIITRIPGLNKIVGDNNEKIAMKAIAKQYDIVETGENYFITKTGEIVTLMGGSHKGYDIKIEKDNEIIKRIEVKPYEKGAVSISPTQWDYAKKYMDQYEIYRIKRISGEPSEIYVLENPYQQYLDKKLELIPSRLRTISPQSPR